MEENSTYGREKGENTYGRKKVENYMKEERCG